MTAGATVTGVRPEKAMVRRARPNGSDDVTVRGPIECTPRRAPVIVYDRLTTRSPPPAPPRRPEPSAGNGPSALPRRPLGRPSRHVPGGVGSAVRTPTRTDTIVSRPTEATSGTSERVT